MGVKKQHHAFGMWLRMVMVCDLLLCPQSYGINPKKQMHISKKRFKNAQKPLFIEKKKVFFFIPILGKILLKSRWKNQSNYFKSLFLGHLLKPVCKSLYIKKQIFVIKSLLLFKLFGFILFFLYLIVKGL